MNVFTWQDKSLCCEETPLAEIALVCGFSDQSHLSFLFKRYMGMSPSKFRSLAGHGGEEQPVAETWRNPQARLKVVGVE